MKKVIWSLMLASLFVAGLWTVNYFQKNYHKTPEAAFEELVQTSDATVFPLDDNRLALLLNRDGSISIAFMYVERLFDIYKDFEIYPTKLNVFEASLNDSIPYTVDPEFLGYSFGLIKNERVAYTAWRDLPPGNDSKVIALYDHTNDSGSKDVSLWTFPVALSARDLEKHLLFLDKEKKTVPIDGKELIAEEVE